MSVWQDHRALPPMDWERTHKDWQQDGIPAAASNAPLKDGFERREMDMRLSVEDKDEYGFSSENCEDSHIVKLKKRG